MAFGLKKCSLLVMKRAGKKIRFECITLLDGRIMGEIGEGGCKKQNGDEKNHCKRVKEEAETSFEIKIEWKEWNPDVSYPRTFRTQTIRTQS